MANKKAVELIYIGRGRFDEIPVYRDQYNKYWADLNYQDKDKPQLRNFILGMDDYDDWQHRLTQRKLINDYYPNRPIKIISDFERDENIAFNYQLLSRYQSDVLYFIGYGDGNLNRLIDDSIDNHITKMKQMYDEFNDDKKPEWISHEIIDIYKKYMDDLMGNDTSSTMEQIDKRLRKLDAEIDNLTINEGVK